MFVSGGAQLQPGAPTAMPSKFVPGDVFVAGPAVFCSTGSNCGVAAPRGRICKGGAPRLIAPGGRMTSRIGGEMPTLTGKLISGGPANAGKAKATTIAPERTTRANFMIMSMASDFRFGSPSPASRGCDGDHGAAAIFIDAQLAVNGR